MPLRTARVGLWVRRARRGPITQRARARRQGAVASALCGREAEPGSVVAGLPFGGRGWRRRRREQCVGRQAISATQGEGAQSPDAPVVAGGAKPGSSSPGWATRAVSLALRVPTTRLTISLSTPTGCSLQDGRGSRGHRVTLDEQPEGDRWHHGFELGDLEGSTDLDMEQDRASGGGAVLTDMPGSRWE